MYGSFLLIHNISYNSSAQLDAWTDSEATETTAPLDPLEGAQKKGPSRQQHGFAIVFFIQFLSHFDL